MPKRKPQKRARPAARHRARSDAALQSGWLEPDGRRIRLADAGDADAAAELLRLAETGLDVEGRMLARDPRLARALRRGLTSGSEAMLRETVDALSVSGTLKEPCVGLSTVLVGGPSGGPVDGALMAFPPVRVLHNALEFGIGLPQVLSAATAVVKLKGVAVAEPARGSGLGTAMIRRCTELYFGLGWAVAYGQFDAASGLDRYYTRLGFDVLAPEQPLPLASLINFPLSIYPMPGERLFARWA